METSFEVPDVRRNFETAQNLFCEKRLVAKQPDATEICRSNPAETTEKRFLELYTFRVQQSCFRVWVLQWRSSAQARHQHRKHLLTTGLSALRWMVLTRRAQADTLARRREALTLAKAFHQWKRHVEERGCSNMDVQSEAEVKSLRRRLAPPSDTLVLRTAYCAWQSHLQGLQLRRAALIHYHLTLMYKHWLLWRQAGWKCQAVVLQGQRAGQLWESRLKRRAYTVWSSSCTAAQQATQHQRRSCLAAAWRVWRAQATLREDMWLVLTNQNAGIHKESLLRHSIQLWREKAEQRRRQKESRRDISKRVAQCWRLYVHRSRLQRVCVEADQILSRHTLAVAFERWRQRKAIAKAAHRWLQGGRHLLERMGLQTVFTRWRRTACAWRGARALLETRTQTQLSKILKGWHGVAERKAVCLRYCCRRERLTAAHALRTWARAREVRVRHTHLLTHLLETRRRAGRQTQTDLVGSIPAPLSLPPRLSSATGRLESVYDILKLQMSFHNWRKQRIKVKRARLYCSALQQKQARLVLQHWHGVAEEVQESQVLRCRTSLAALGNTFTSPTCLESSTGSTQQVLYLHCFSDISPVLPT
ncbi:protein SFI1 homolog [Osmerus eperlanus]|uniref:protein SFI1 homolog n=1 Tax=Osmerus eperlanus TaxID=29151 RepID=UPI002E162E82